MTVMSEKWEKRTLADFATAVCGNNNVVEGFNSFRRTEWH
jgi:hypothetical protein